MDWAWVKHLQDERGRKGLNGLAHTGCGLCRSGEYPTCISCRLHYLTRFKKEWVRYRLTQSLDNSCQPDPTQPMFHPDQALQGYQRENSFIRIPLAWSGAIKIFCCSLSSSSSSEWFTVDYFPSLYSI